VPQLTVSAHRIDVWLVFYDEITDELLDSRLRPLLSEAERQQERRFYFADDRKRHVATRALVRNVLSQYVPIAPADWAFSTNRFGRPKIANRDVEASGLEFNISHTRGLIALGVTQHRALGIDVENVSARSVSLDLANHYFARDEVAELASVAPEHRHGRFFEYWTFKESYIKARGMGLSIPLDRFSFSFPHARGVQISIQPDLGDEASRWCFWQVRPTSEYLLAICAERSGVVTERLTMTRIVPAVVQTRLEVSCSRSSTCWRLERCSTS
jgi:4'-phosphopantetheinyl transferase